MSLYSFYNPLIVVITFPKICQTSHHQYELILELHPRCNLVIPIMLPITTCSEIY